MGRRSCGVVAKKILDVLSSNLNRSMTIQEISKASGVSWDSSKRHLELFAKLKFIRENNIDGKAAYQKLRTFESDTLFSIPLSDEHREIIRKIYSSIEKMWKSVSSKAITKTLMQKIAVDVVEKRYPEIPRGWYLYGEVLLLHYEMDQQYRTSLDKKEDIKLVKEVCGEYAQCCDYSHQIRIHQYKKKNKGLYLVKEKLFYLLTHADFSDSNKLNKIREMLNDFAIKCERRDNNSAILVIVDDFCSNALSIFRNSESEDLDKARTAIIESFSAVWQLVATYELYYSLSSYIDKDVLWEYLSAKIKSLQDICFESIESLEDFKPKYAYTKDEISKKLRSIMGSAKPVSSEEKKKRIDEIEAIRKTKGEQELDKFLSEKLGLYF